jgi:hypothetical protein
MVMTGAQASELGERGLEVEEEWLNQVEAARCGTLAVWHTR